MAGKANPLRKKLCAEFAIAGMPIMLHQEAKDRGGIMTNATHTAKHTPGPWVAKGTTVWGNPSDPVMGHLTIATTKTCAGETIGQANATLIAAAPAMYEALKLAATMHPYNVTFQTALAQAEGKQ